MSGELRPAHGRAPGVEPEAPVGDVGTGPSRRRAPAAPLSQDSRLAIEIRSLVESSRDDEARDRFGELVALHQRRASRIAFQYLRDAADADEAVQDAFVKAFSHITSYRDAWPFEVTCFAPRGNCAGSSEAGRDPPGAPSSGRTPLRLLSGRAQW